MPSLHPRLPALAVLLAAACLAEPAPMHAQRPMPPPDAPAPQLNVFTPPVEFGAIPLAPGESPDQPALPEIRALIASSSWAMAESLCRQILATPPPSPDAQYLLAYTLYRQGRATDSLQAYTAAARLRKPQPQDLMAVAADYVVLADYNDADHWFTRVTQLTPTDPLAWYYRGRAEYKLEQYSAALLAFQQARILNPQSARTQDNLGLTYQMFNDTRSAQAAFTRAVQLETAHPSGYSLPFLNLGALLVTQGDLKAALPYLQKAVTLSPANPKAREELAQAYEQDGQLPAAQRELEAAVAAAPDASALHYLLGRLYLKLGKRSEAAEQFARTATLNAQQAPSEVPNRLTPKPK